MMELKKMSKEQYENTVSSRFGRMQAIVMEFYNSDMDYCEVINPYLHPSSFLSGFNTVAGKMGIPVKASLRGMRVFLRRIYDGTKSNAEAGD